MGLKYYSPTCEKGNAMVKIRPIMGLKLQQTRPIPTMGTVKIRPIMGLKSSPSSFSPTTKS